jgi:predicted metal-binding membrane protein
MIIVAWAAIVPLAGGMTMGDQQTMSAASPPPTAPTRQMPGLAHSVALICILTKPGMPRRQFMAEHSVGSSSSLSLSSSGIWALMIVAMMLPSALPAATYAGAQSLRWRRRRTMLEFVLGYAAVWLPVGTLILTATAGLRGSYAAC